MGTSNGRSDETEALYREHRAAVAAFCHSLLRDRSDTEDATQQVFLSAHRALLNGTAPREPLAWLLAVARNECYARFRQRKAAPVAAGEAPEVATPDASVHVLRAGELASVWDEVGRMPPAQREAFLLREIRGLSYAQLADELSLSRPSVRSLLLRARTRLRHRLGDVAAAVGGVPWVQALLRLVAGGDGASPVPAATKAVAVGLGALALAGAGSPPRGVHHASKSARHTVVRHRAVAHTSRAAAAPVAVAVTQREDRPRLDTGGSEHSRRRERGSGSSGSGSSESRDSHDGGRDSGEGMAPVTAPLVQPAASGDGDGGSGGDPGPSATTTTTTVTTTTADGGSGDGGHDGDSGSSSGSSDGGGHDGGGDGGS